MRRADPSSARQTQRRADIAALRREVSCGVVTSLVAPDDPRLHDQTLMRNAIAHWKRGLPTRGHRCFGCSAPFITDSDAAAYLLVTASTAPLSCGVAGMCARCWADLPDDKIERAAARTLRAVMPRGFPKGRE